MLILVSWGQKTAASTQTYRLTRALGVVAILVTGCGASAAAVDREATHPRAGLSNAVGTPSDGTAALLGSRPAALALTRVAKAGHTLAIEATLPEILQVALAQNPELAEAQARVRAARELAPAATRLPDPEFDYQLWAQPLARPYALDEAQMHMFGLRQRFPAPGTLRAQSQAAQAQANLAEQVLRARHQDVIQRVRRAYAEYYRADREFQIHLEHAQLAHQIVDVARAVYQGGRGTQQDVLRAGLAVSRLHNDVAAIDAARRTARAMLNTLMAREPDAPLGPPAPIEATSVDVRLDRLDRLLTDQRPELVAAQSAIAVRESELDAAQSSARWPSFMLGVQYMYMPPESDPHNYGVMFSMSLPWLNPRYAEQLRAAEANVSAERSALASARLAARYELYEAAERLQAARNSLTLLDHDLLPLARQNFESAQASYRGGQSDSLGVLDALGSLFDVRLERERTLVRLDTALADLERAVGAPLPLPHDDGARAQ